MTTDATYCDGCGEEGIDRLPLTSPDGPLGPEYWACGSCKREWVDIEGIGTYEIPTPAPRQHEEREEG